MTIYQRYDIDLSFGSAVFRVNTGHGNADGCGFCRTIGIFNIMHMRFIPLFHYFSCCIRYIKVSDAHTFDSTI